MNQVLEALREMVRRKKLCVRSGDSNSKPGLWENSTRDVSCECVCTRMVHSETFYNKRIMSTNLLTRL